MLSTGLGDNTTIDVSTFGNPPLDYSTIPAVVSPPPLDTSPAISSTFDWNSFWANTLGSGIKNIAAPILNSQFGGPKPGQYFASTPTGNIAYALPAESSGGITNPFGTLTSGSLSSFMPMILLGLALFVGVKMFSGGK